MSEHTITSNANTDGSTTIVLGGALSIETCDELHKIMSESLNEYPQIMLNFQALESIDLTCMQIICSSCKTAAKMGRGFDYVSDTMPDCMISFGRIIGAPQGLPCSQNDNKPCIMYGGKG
jgi:ABC-type transporter Mla MlaB component